MTSTNGILNRIFQSCEEDPKSSIHRAWGISLIFVILYFILSMFEMANLQAGRGSTALVIASVWTGIIHLCLGILGTFVLKRFPTSFSVGFFLGVLTVLANQNLIVFGTFHGYSYGNSGTNHVFANIGFTLFCILSFFSLLVFHFKSYIIVAPIDVKNGPRTPAAAPTNTEDYQKYDETA